MIGMKWHSECVQFAENIFAHLMRGLCGRLGEEQSYDWKYESVIVNVINRNRLVDVMSFFSSSFHIGNKLKSKVNNKKYCH